jgi:ATP-dependent Lon protease
MIPESNVKDLMLRKDVIGAVKKKKFRVYAVKTIDQGIEVLTGKRAGEIKPDGTFPRGSINYLVDKKLKDLALGIKNFGEEDKKEDNNKRKRKKGKAKKE